MSRNTVMEAYELLIQEGYLYTQRAVDPFVAERVPDESFTVESAATAFPNA